MSDILGIVFGLLILGIGWFAVYLIKEEVVEPKFNKVKTNFKVSKQYNSLFGKGNWKMTDYSYSKMQDYKMSSYDGEWYNIYQSYKIEVLNKNNCPNNHLSEEDMRLLSIGMKKYDWALLHEYNPNLFMKMEKYLDPEIFKEKVDPFKLPWEF